MHNHKQRAQVRAQWSSSSLAESHFNYKTLMMKSLLWKMWNKAWNFKLTSGRLKAQSRRIAQFSAEKQSRKICRRKLWMSEQNKNSITSTQCEGLLTNSLKKKILKWLQLHTWPCSVARRGIWFIRLAFLTCACRRMVKHEMKRNERVPALRHSNAFDCYLLLACLEVFLRLRACNHQVFTLMLLLSIEALSLDI